MLENIPRPLGKALRSVRAGIDKVACNADGFADTPQTLVVTSSAFTDGDALPARFTADAGGASPPLEWSNIPDGAASFVVLIEDPDAPAREPLVHALVWNLSATTTALHEAELKGPSSVGRPHDFGRNSFNRGQYLPPDPPRGHGPHRCVFQVFALDQRLDLEDTPRRSTVLAAMDGRVLAKGVIVGTYERV